MIVVTGASKGIGRAVSERLAKSGQEVLGISRTGQHPDFQIHHADVSDLDSLRAISEKIRKNKQHISALINTAGIASMNLALLANKKSSEDVMKVNFLGTLFACQAFVPLIIRNSGGHVINFSSIAAKINLQGESVYAASKAAIENFTRTLAKEVSSFNISVNCIAPGPIQTDLLLGLAHKQISDVIDYQIFKKQYELDDVCDLVEVLLDDKTKMLTGEVLHIGGVR
jgi:3-oxoacyl-[acyl-carrier protein] reductase